MFDFAQIEERTLEVKLISGEKLHLTLPTKRKLDTLGEYAKLVNEATVYQSDKIDRIYSIFSSVLSENTEKKSFSKKDTEGYSLDAVFQFMTGYVNFVSGETNNPN